MIESQPSVRSRRSMQCDCGMTTCLPQQVPLFRHINVQLGFRPEFLDRGAAADAFQSYFMFLMVRVDAAAAADAFNIASDKAGFRRTFSNEPESVVISGNSHFSLAYAARRFLGAGEGLCMAISASSKNLLLRGSFGRCSQPIFGGGHFKLCEGAIHRSFFRSFFREGHLPFLAFLKPWDDMARN